MKQEHPKQLPPRTSRLGRPQQPGGKKWSPSPPELVKYVNNRTKRLSARERDRHALIETTNSEENE